ncbi:alpha/beta fold hydrolase [Ramlibacter albus]|uniref:Alpha/beta hydrolase n=1 Tax=Ramlibacter albus TaxID=2079448 RepID=A0A923MDL0_9BURK|nr:alpha/beta hydrolase [Ramlibacter albus]MBC5768070.1 alpha/beta hydrolase [Ramlibacter albus]
MYQPRRIFRNQFVPIRNLNYHVLTWGEPGPGKVPLVMVHGWMDVAASYQFVVDEFERDHYVIAPDWRGYGATDVPHTDNYWFPDYLADLDFLIDHFSPDQPVNLVGHSMGGNVAMHYSGVKPARVRRLVNLEGFGMPKTKPSQAPGRLAKWIDELKAYHRGEMELKPYDSADGVAQRLMKTNKRLTQDKAGWLARHWAKPDAEGKWRILGHAAHKIVNANLSREDEVLELYKAITAPTLAVVASDDSLSQWWQGRFTLAQYEERLKSVSDHRVVRIEDAGHMMHHDQPRQLAQHIESFLGG